MIQKSPSPKDSCIRINFSIPGTIWADKIALAGDFNNWDYHSHLFTQTMDGSWQTALDLPIGNKYQFRYWIDGQWSTDFQADGFATEAGGHQNAVVHT